MANLLNIIPRNPLTPQRVDALSQKTYYPQEELDKVKFQSSNDITLGLKKTIASMNNNFN